MTRPHTCLGLALIALLGPSCALFQKPEPVVTTVTQLVDRPVKVPCLQPHQKPIQPKRLVEDNPAPPPTLTEMVGRLRAKLKEWQDGYGPTTDELLTICSTLPAPPQP